MELDTCTTIHLVHHTTLRGTIVGTDFFDKPDTLRNLWPKLIRSWSIDALERLTQNPGSTSPQEISSWLESSASATQEPFPSPGMGMDVRIEGKDVIGASLVIDDHPIHMELFRRKLPQQHRRSEGPEPVTHCQSDLERPIADVGRPPTETRSRAKRWLDRILLWKLRW